MLRAEERWAFPKDQAGKRVSLLAQKRQPVRRPGQSRELRFGVGLKSKNQEARGQELASGTSQGGDVWTNSGDMCEQVQIIKEIRTGQTITVTSTFQM